MSDKKRYKVKVTEKHVDYVWVIASSPKEAADEAVTHAECEFDCTHDAEIVKTEELTESK